MYSYFQRNTLYLGILVFLSLLLFLLPSRVFAAIIIPPEPLRVQSSSARLSYQLDGGVLGETTEAGFSSVLPFSLPYQDSLSYQVIDSIDARYLSDEQRISFSSSNGVYGVTISGTAVFDSPLSVARLIFVTREGLEYMVYEGYPLLSGGQTQQLDGYCRETCLFFEEMPAYVRAETEAGHFENLSIELHAFKTPPKNEFIAETKKALQQSQVNATVYALNQNIDLYGLSWQAGDTFMARISYTDKKRMFTMPDRLPNLQGIDYYIGGIFALPNVSKVAPNTDIIKSFDWRNINGQNFVTSTKNQKLCGSCWAFSTTAVIETLINIEQRTSVDHNLSERSIVELFPDSCVNGNYLGASFEQYLDEGVITDTCYDKGQFDPTCRKERWKISSFSDITDVSDENIKNIISEKGPITFGVYSWLHFMAAIGYHELEDGRTAWILKNSWGEDWGVNGVGYLLVAEEDRYGLTYAENPFRSVD